MAPWAVCPTDDRPAPAGFDAARRVEGLEALADPPAREVDDGDEALGVGGRERKRRAAWRRAEEERRGEGGGLQELAAGHAWSYGGARRRGPGACERGARTGRHAAESRPRAARGNRWRGT